MSLLSEGEFFEAIREISGKVLNKEQREAISYTEGPLKIVAGPGSGKTEVLVLKTLYLMAVKGVNPRSIFLASFTKKAAQELLTRIVSYTGKLKKKFPFLSLEPYELYCGTIHSLAAKVMDEFQYPEYEKKRLIEDFERELLIYRTFKKLLESKRFNSFFLKIEYKNNALPTLRQKLTFVSFLIDFLIQNRIDEGELLKEKDYFLRLSGKVLKRYREVSQEESFLDYTLLEELFLKFLTSKEGETFLKGDGTDYFPGIKFTLVDEYQDTNPLDEEIYFTLSSSTLNLTVVGDEDQALYRFRGAVVECFVNFEDSFKERFNRKPRVIKLLKNYRSNKVIVDFLNHFMGKHKEGKLKGAWRELSSSKELLFSSGIDSTRSLPKAVLKIRRNRRELARFCLSLVKSLKEEGVIENYSDVVLLLPTTRELRGNGRKSLAGYVRELFEREKIPVYNPRSKAFKEKREVKALIWALSQVLPKPKEVDNEVLRYLDACSGEFELPKEDFKVLREISHSLKAGLLELFYRLLSLFNFSSQEEKLNLAQLSNYLYYIESFARSEVEKGRENGKLFGSFTCLNKIDLGKDELCRLISFYEFYSTFLYLFVRGEIDQRELPKIPENSFPIMTIHQSKGLEFPIVIVGEVGSSSPDFRLSKLEEIFSKYLNRNQVDPFERGVIDSVKKFFVAYSRAIYALFILIEDDIEEGYWRFAALPNFGGRG